MNNNEMRESMAEALRRKIQEEGESLEDIDFISVGMLGLYVDDFWNSAATIEWNINKLKDNFRIVFKDGTWISKHYSRNGDVRLQYHKTPDRPGVTVLMPSKKDFLDQR